MDKQTIKKILEREIERHTDEITEHKNKYIKSNSKKQREKMDKHFHKRFQTILIAKKLGFTFCECCGTLVDSEQYNRRGSSRQKKCGDSLTHQHRIGTYPEEGKVSKENDNAYADNNYKRRFVEDDILLNYKEIAKDCKHVAEDIIARMEYKDKVKRWNGKYKW